MNVPTDIAKDAIGALKQQPMLLALVILQVVVLVAVIYTAGARQKATSEQFRHVFTLLEQCMKRGQP